MTPGDVSRIEHLLLVVGIVAMVIAVGTFDWRIGLFFGGLLLVASSTDIRWRRS
jgi:hypothetical protein